MKHRKEVFFSYACGVAYQILTHYQVSGLQIDNYITDLPIMKGLSSSAAICVLVARAFNRIYDLKMTVRGEMEYAYQGEITTPSRCGRMDQGCAYGDKPILMTFDGDRIDVMELKLQKDLFFVIVDLVAIKNTIEILAKLNQCFPFADDDIKKNVHKYLGPINRKIINEAVTAIQQGDSEQIGKLMKKAQIEFDKHLKPACPSQLTAPVLHKVLNYKPIQPYICGGKGVGSQGDGAAQFIVKDEKSQKKVIEIIERELNMSCLPLSIRSIRKIRKAVIPAAGFGTRLFPASKTIKKELFPIIDSNNMAKPVILLIIEEAINAGIEESSIIIQERDRKTFEVLLYTSPFIENFNKLSKENQIYSNYLLDLGRHITLLNQDTQDGFGHAVYCAKEWVNDEPFLLMLGDHLHSSDTDVSCTRQLLDVYERFNKNIVGLKVISKEDLGNFGCVTGKWEEKDSILRITKFYEKPTVDYAREHLQIEDMKNTHYLALSGQYILSPKIFHCLEEHIRYNIREDGEYQLTSCLDKLRKEEGFMGYIIKGKNFDIGIPEKYRQTIIDYYKCSR
ncbi:Galactokinase [subsurface metagenome]